jgi:hypothetical protein
LNNCFTEALKALRPAPRHASGLRIGRLFGRVLTLAEPEPESGHADAEAN